MIVPDSTVINPDSTVIEPDAAQPPATWPETVTLLHLEEGAAEASSGFLDAPSFNADWARAPTVACWDNPLTDEFYAGPHRLFALDAPVTAWTELTITLTPLDGVEANLYVIEQVEGARLAPPEIDDAAFCHAPVQFGSAGVPQSITLRVYEPREILFGVSNRGRLARDRQGEFTVEVTARALPEAERCYMGVEAPARWPSHVRAIALNDGHAAFTDDLSSGAPICGDLSFLDDAFCVPMTQVDRFNGNHVLYALEAPIPANSFVTITVTPDPGVDINLYGAFQGLDGYYTPPNYPIQSCDASLTADRPNPGQSESLTFFAFNHGYNISFAVAGYGEAGAAGGYTVAVEWISTRTDHCDDTDYDLVTGLDAWPAHVQRITPDENGLAVIHADLNEGQLLCTLDWASTSSLACFPATQNAYFEGKHLFFALAEPPPPGADIYVRAVPDEGVEVSLYGYQIGATRYSVPPLVPSAVACEASYAATLFESLPDPGVIEEIEFINPAGNPYNYFFGLAGFAEEQLQGGVTLEVAVIQPPPPHCPESLPGATYPTWPPSVKQLSLSAEGHLEARGDLREGSCVNLDFASDSAVACFPATQNAHFAGNHVFYALDEPIPPRSELIITLTPDAGVDANLYGFQVGVDSYPVPPAVSSAICEASFSPNAPNPGQAEVIRFSNPSERNAYHIAFVAAGPGVTGGYTITAELRVGQVHCAESLPGVNGLDAWPDDVEIITLVENQGTTRGDLAQGGCVNLDFASNSSVACFPATQNARFEGNHAFYAVEQLMPPHSVMAITATPDPGVDVSLYGFQLGANTYFVPPAVPQAICEASYATNQPNPGAPETIQFFNPTENSYRIFFAVAGDREGGAAGGYSVDVALEVAEAHCPASLPGRGALPAWPDDVTLVPLGAPVAGDLSTGNCVNLDFAANSSMSCFPATQNEHFRGNHVFFALAEPLPPRTIVTLTARPTDGADINLYGYQIGEASFRVPPNVPSCVACEASYAVRAPNPGAPESISFSNPSYSSSYQIFFAVAGAAEAGAFTVEAVLAD
ncbi:hypothetical protein KJ940_04730 [Myxococcota bacterium]|nr:hypothetical protein [Myxococcota bacterium]